jgi:hypothetical protein
MTKRYDEHKGKIFVIVKGECTLDMKNKVESLKGSDSIEANDDVISKTAGQRVIS